MRSPVFTRHEKTKPEESRPYLVRDSQKKKLWCLHDASKKENPACENIEISRTLLNIFKEDVMKLVFFLTVESVQTNGRVGGQSDIVLMFLKSEYLLERCTSKRWRLFEKLKTT